MTIGDKIKALRAQKDISQQELAKALKVSDQAISAWENNKKIPRMGSVEKLAAFFNVPKTFLIEDDLDLENITPQLASTATFAFTPVLSSILSFISAAGTLLNTYEAHADNKTKEEHPAPFLMTKDDDEKEILRLYRELTLDNKKTVRVLLESLANSSK